MIRISLSRVEVAEGAAPAVHREAFAQRHLVVFKRFIDPAVLERVPRLLAQADFFTREDTSKQGATPKCSFAGWFCGGASFRHLIRMRSWRE